MSERAVAGRRLAAVLLLLAASFCSGLVHAQAIAAAVLPSSRSGLVDQTVTAFATILVAGGTATGCTISPEDEVPATFFFRQTDPQTNAIIGEPNVPVDIEGSQSFVLGFTPTEAFPAREISLRFDCENTAPAAVVSGLNTFTLSASTEPVPDVISIAVTPDPDGVTRPEADGALSAFSVAAVNIGRAGDLDVRVDTGIVSLVTEFTVCQTVPATGLCLAPPAAPPLALSLASNEVATLSVFVAAGAIPFDPARHRVRVRFADADDNGRGSTSVAIAALRATPAGKLGIIGDSLAAGTHTDEMCGRRDIVECVEDRGGFQDRTWTYAGGEQSWSVAQRLGYPPARVLDASDDGEEWKDAFDQASDLVADPELRDVFIGLGANDVCQARGYEYTNDLELAAQHMDNTLTLLTDRLPAGGRILLSGMPNVVAMRDLMQTLDHNYIFESCQATWDVDTNRVKSEAANDACDHFSSKTFCELLDNTGDARDFLIELLLEQLLDREGVDEGPCGKVLSKSSTDEDRAEALAYSQDLNRLMAEKALEYHGRNGVAVHFNDRVFQASTNLEPHHVSRFDCYHASRSGQKKLADEFWSAFRFGAVSPGLVATDNFDTPDYCSAEVDEWASCWTELGDDDSAETGFVRVREQSLRVGNRNLGIERGLDLGAATSAWLSFVWQRQKLDQGADYVTLDLSADGGDTWQELDRFRGDGDDFNLHRGSNYDITEFASADTRLRLLGSPELGDGDKVDFDHFKVLAWNPSSGDSPDALGRTLVDDDPVPVALPSADDVPVVLTGVPEDLSDDVSLAQVRTITSESFELALAPVAVAVPADPRALVAHLALPEGVFALPDGSLWEVGRLAVDGSGAWTAQAFAAPFDRAPAVFASLQDAGEEARVVRVRSVQAAGFEVNVYQPLSTELASEPATIGYVAVQAGTDNGRLEAPDISVPYALSQVALGDMYQEVLGVSLRRFGSQGEAETVDVLRLGNYVFAQEVSILGELAAVVQQQPASP